MFRQYQLLRPDKTWGRHISCLAQRHYHYCKTKDISQNFSSCFCSSTNVEDINLAKITTHYYCASRQWEVTRPCSQLSPPDRGDMETNCKYWALIVSQQTRVIVISEWQIDPERKRRSCSCWGSVKLNWENANFRIALAPNKFNYYQKTDIFHCPIFLYRK